MRPFGSTSSTDLHLFFRFVRLVLIRAHMTAHKSKFNQMKSRRIINCGQKKLHAKRKVIVCRRTYEPAHRASTYIVIHNINIWI